jgi:GAF domain-containing protein
MMLDDRAPPAEPSQIIADLRRERDEALSREAAIAEVLQVINSSPGDLAPVFQTMLEKAIRLCEATHGTLRTFDGEAFHLAASAHREALALPDAGRGPSSLFRRFIDGQEIIHLADVLDSPEYQFNPGVRAGMDAARARSWLGVSLRKEARLLGAISVVRQELRPFSDEQIALLRNFAAQAVLAMENARLLSETREALEQQTATAEVMQVINSSPGNLAPVFDAMLDKAHTLCGAAAGALLIFEGKQYRVAAVHGAADLAAIWAPGTYLPMPPCDEDSPIPRLMRGEPLIHLPDATDDPMYRAYERYRRLIDAAGLRTLLVVPLRKERAVLGAITAFHREVRPFSNEQIALLQNFAAQAVIAMENARLLTETQEALEQQTATAEVLQVINSSPGDLAPVFDALLEKATRLCAASHGVLRTFDGKLFHLAAVHGESNVVERERQRGPVRAAGGLLRGILDGERLIHIADVRETDTWRDYPAVRERLEAGASAAGSEWHCARTAHFSARSRCIARRYARSPKRKSRSCRTSRRRRSSQWKMRGS